MLVRAGASGMIYNIFLYGGKRSNDRKPQSAANIVLALSKEIPKKEGYQLYFDNWFSTFEVMLTLKSSKIFTTATFRSSRLQGCPLESDKDLKKQGPGSFEYRTDVNTGLHVVKWFDNKCGLNIFRCKSGKRSPALGRQAEEIFQDIDIGYAVSYGTRCLSNLEDFTNKMMIHDHEEADTLILLHAVDVSARKKLTLYLIYIFPISIQLLGKQ